jgi:hypothetical protein
LNYALEVEKITLKKPNLILSVCGVIAVFFVDLLRHSGSFTRYLSILKNMHVVTNSMNLYWVRWLLESWFQIMVNPEYQKNKFGIGGVTNGLSTWKDK